MARCLGADHLQRDPRFLASATARRVSTPPRRGTDQASVLVGGRSMPRSGVRRGGVTRIGSMLLVVWLLIGLLAAGQRHYFSGSASNCAKAGAIAVTIVAGPLNYIGVNPKVTSCHVPQPSK